MGGFEGACFSFRDGRRVDCISATKHDQYCRTDYELLQSFGLSTVRDSFRWPLIERSRDQYDWSSVEPMIRAAVACGTEVIWDLCHFGLPDWLHMTSGEFPQRFAAFATAAAEFVASIDPRPQWWCPINEISYWAFAAGELAYMKPYHPGQADFLKSQMVSAHLAACKAIKRRYSSARFLATDPLIWVSDDAGNGAAAEIDASFEAWDMILGRKAAQLGGTIAACDVIGVNYYANNQWRTGSRESVGMAQHGYRPLRELLRDVWNRYRKPILVSETGAEEPNGSNWLAYVQNEVRVAQETGVAVVGICVYPVMDYPGWVDNRHCQCGIVELDADWDARVRTRALGLPPAKNAKEDGGGAPQPVGLECVL